ncbi:hypothetical protein U9M48_039254 [Paspalum notatum var. saurae]|uniref:Uncharacterized protein n=1 Tax=Paspalum notatum var. saurae TaxID=547442 RepID=A0AAQ3UKE0_PASNO
MAAPKRWIACFSFAVSPSDPGRPPPEIPCWAMAPPQSRATRLPLPSKVSAGAIPTARRLLWDGAPPPLGGANPPPRQMEP